MTTLRRARFGETWPPRLLGVVGLLGLAAAWPHGAGAQGRARPHVPLALLEPRAEEPTSPETARSLRALGSAVSRRTSVEADRVPPVTVTPTDAELFEHPLVFVRGRDAFPEWSDDVVDSLSRYVALGGMVVIDDAGGDPESPFSASARGALSRVMGGREFQVVSRDHSLYRAFYLLERSWGRLDTTPELEAIFLDGRVAVLYSANDLLGALEKDSLGRWSRPVSPGGRGQRENAFRLGVNVVLHALTLDYKEDLVHLPHILERRR